MRLLSAEILKLRRRRGLLVWCSLLTIGSVVVAYGVVLALHVANPARHGPAGGAHNLQNMMWLLISLATVAAAILGTTAGSQDVSAGVFRDLVVTGRSRRTLFRVRFPGALAVFVPMLAAAYAVAVGGAYAFAGNLATPTLHQVASYGVSAGLLGVVTLAAAVSLGAILPSRVATGVLISWNAIIAGLLAAIPNLGHARDAIDVAAAAHFAPALYKDTVPMSAGTALVVLAMWVAVALRAGTWWTKRLDA
jgi:ABC-type transport system involved in multi-copper enzyme maturation permease subunit